VITALLGLIVATGAASALDGNDTLELQIAGGSHLSGWFYSVADGVLTLSGGDTFQSVPVASITSVRRDGELLPLDRFHAEVGAAQATLEAFRADPPPHPAAGVVIGASVLWAGAAPAAVGDWKRFAAYSVVEGVLVGTAIANVSAGSGAVLLPLAALDILFKGYAAGESVRVTKKRRAQLKPRPVGNGGEAPPAR
jgi:hypothetical protein